MEHTVSAFEHELRDLSTQTVRMGEIAAEQLDDGLKAIFRRDTELADRVVQRDRTLDSEAADVERKAIRLIALRQPMADDLRRPIAVMKIAANLERVGDLAKNIAKRSRVIGEVNEAFPIAALEDLGRLVADRLDAVMKAYRARDIAGAIKVWSKDEEIDSAHEALAREILATMTRAPGGVESGMHLLFAAKNLERIGDHATNIAELVHYEIAGTDIEGARPKKDELETE